MMIIPDWLKDALRKEDNPYRPRNLLFHGTVEPFKGQLKPTSWEGLLWFSNDPVVSQSYCPNAGLSALWAVKSWAMNERFVPAQGFEEELMRMMGFDPDAMEIERDDFGRAQCYRILDNHPTNRDVAVYITETLGYVLENDACWISLKNDKVMPASWKEPGRLYVAARPEVLDLHDMRKEHEDGITGQQWMRTSDFARVKKSGRDGVIISDIHHTPRLGHFGHDSFGLFGKTINQMTFAEIPCVFFDPAAAWYGDKEVTSPEWKALVDEALAVAEPAMAS